MINKCIICSHVGPQYLAQDFNTYKIYTCTKCKFGIVDPMPTEEELERMYNSTEYFTHNMHYDFETISDEEIRGNIDKFKSMHKEFVWKYIKPGQRVLDIGSGGGFALKAFEEMGLIPLGVETSAVAQQFAVHKLGLNVVKSSLEEFTTREKFDIIFMNHVLEHFMNPNEAMRIIALLKTGGVLYLRVPDHDSFDREVMKEKWPGYAHYHISNFSESSLRVLFKKNNIEVMAVRKYIAISITGIKRLILKKLPFQSLWVNKFNGRTITVVGVKK
jgi:SAM-dependent methyltransferase